LQIKYFLRGKGVGPSAARASGVICQCDVVKGRRLRGCLYEIKSIDTIDELNLSKNIFLHEGVWTKC
jgi:hypothetical protein